MIASSCRREDAASRSLSLATSSPTSAGPGADPASRQDLPEALRQRDPANAEVRPEPGESLRPLAWVGAGDRRELCPEHPEIAAEDRVVNVSKERLRPGGRTTGTCWAHGTTLPRRAAGRRG